MDARTCAVVSCRVQAAMRRPPLDAAFRSDTVHADGCVTAEVVYLQVEILTISKTSSKVSSAAAP